MRVFAMFVAVTAGSAPAKPGEGVQAGGDVVVRPFVDAAISHDSNPLLLPEGQEVDGFFLDASPGFSMTRAGESSRMEGLFWGRLRRFDELTSEDKDDWSEELRLGLGRREGWRLQLHERFGRVSDYDLSVRTMDASAEGAGDRFLERPEAAPLSVMERSERVDRDILDCGIGVGGPLTDTMSLDALCDYGKIDYLTKDLLDSTEVKASVKVARKMTDKSSGILVGEYIRMENDSLANPADYYAARGGWRWQGTFKSRFEGSVGCAGFTVDDPTLNESLDRDAFSYDMAWYWQAWPKLSISFGGRREMQLTADTAQNAKLVDMVTSSAKYSATRRLSLTLLAGYRHEDFTQGEEVAGQTTITRVVEQLHGRVRCDYRVRKWLSAYGEMWMEDTTDNVRGDYVETRGTLGVKAEY